MYKSPQRVVLAVLLIGAIAPASASRDRLDIETLEAWMAHAGFADVHAVRGGMTAWLKNGWPTGSGPEKSEMLP